MTPVHTGSGDLNYFEAATPSRDPRYAFIEELDWLWRRFVHPPGYGRANDLLEVHRTVLLSGEPGSGRVATAKALLRGLSTGGERFHELVWQEDEKSARYRFESGDVGHDDRVWLDLTQLDDRGWRAFQDELSSVRKMIAERSALLVVVLPGKDGHRLWPEFTRLHARIQRPDAHEVLRRHLRMAEVPDAVRSPLPEFLHKSPPLRDVARFAHLVHQAYLKNPSRDYGVWYRAAESARTGHDATVALSVANKLRSGPQRALLLASAMLQGAHADHVYDAALQLLSTVSYTDKSHLLERSDLRESLEAINAELDDRGHVRFKDLGYDAAVRAHFWHHMPELRSGIRQWVAKMIDRSDLPDKDRDFLVEQFAEQCLHPRYRQVLVDAVAEWTSGASAYRRQMAADRALQQALKNEQHGGFFRKQIYDWATDDHLPEALSEVVIMMCVKVIALSHPDQALVRLHHRARRERRAIARTALMELVSSAPWFRRFLLTRLTRPLDGSRKKYERDPYLFLELVDPAAFTNSDDHNRPLIAEAGVRDMLTDGWRLVFLELDEPAWREQLRQWLVVACHDERHRNSLIDVLVSAADQRTTILGRLYSEARAVSRSADGSTDFLDVVLREISISQGLRIP